MSARFDLGVHGGTGRRDRVEDGEREREREKEPVEARGREEKGQRGKGKKEGPRAGTDGDSTASPTVEKPGPALNSRKYVRSF